MGTNIHKSLSNLILDPELDGTQRWICDCVSKGDYKQLIQFLETAKNDDLKQEVFLVVQAALNLCQVCQQQQLELDMTWEAYQRSVNQEKILNENLAKLMSNLVSSTAIIRSSDKGIDNQDTESSGFTAQPLWQRLRNVFTPSVAPKPLEPEKTKDPLTKQSPPPKQAIEIKTIKEELLTLEVYCFGKFCIYIDGKEVEEWTGNKGKSILKYLLFHPGPIPREILMETFWPSEDPETTRRNLYQAIYVLRQSLQTIKPNHKYIITNNGSYLIDPDLTIWIDSDAFLKHLEIGQSFIDGGQLEKAISEFEAAIALYQDDFLPEDIYEDWLLLFRENLKNKYLEILNWLCRHYFSQGQFTFSINYARKIISQDHCREDAHRLLMRAYMKLGQRHLALKQYHQCSLFLMDELEVEPMPATQSLYEKIS